MNNKKGQGLSTNAIVLIILGVVVLIVLVLGFTLGFNRVAPFLSSSNVDTIVNSCSAACSTNAVYDYCTAKRDIKFDGGRYRDVTCDYLNQKQTQFGVASCTAITCDDLVLEETLTTSMTDEQKDDLCSEENEGKTIYNLVDEDTLVSHSCP